jgi:hypothetical protein
MAFSCNKKSNIELIKLNVARAKKFKTLNSHSQQNTIGKKCQKIPQNNKYECL